jgi:hypothetical protein
LTTWILSPLIVWLISLIAGLALFFFLLRKVLETKQDS